MSLSFPLEFQEICHELQWDCCGAANIQLMTSAPLELKATVYVCALLKLASRSLAIHFAVQVETGLNNSFFR
ncbi:hypothetical protein GN956_G16302 [Arapaima gigas]